GDRKARSTRVWPRQAYRKPCKRRHLKIKQIQGQNCLRLCIPKPIDKCTDHDRLRPSRTEKAKAECPVARSARRCTCELARTLRRWKIKSASFGKSPSGGAGMWGSLQRCRHLRRQGTKRTAWPRFHAQGRQPAEVRYRHGMGD